MGERKARLVESKEREVTGQGRKGTDLGYCEAGKTYPPWVRGKNERSQNEREFYWEGA